MIEYPPGVEVRKVRSSGEIRWQGHWFFVSHALVGEPIGFEQVDTGAGSLASALSSSDTTQHTTRSFTWIETGLLEKRKTLKRFPLSHRPYD